MKGKRFKVICSFIFIMKQTCPRPVCVPKFMICKFKTNTHPRTETDDSSPSQDARDGSGRKLTNVCTFHNN